MAESDNLELQALKEENELLLSQLEQVQEELEQYYLNGGELHEGPAAAGNTRARIARPTQKMPIVPTHGLVSRVRRAKDIEGAGSNLDEIVRGVPDFKRLRIDLEQANKKISKLESDLESLGAEKAQLENSSEGLGRQLKTNTGEIGGLQSRIADLEKEREELESARRELSEQVEARARALDEAKAEWDGERQSLETSKEAEIGGLQSRIADLEKEREELESARRELSEQVEARARALDQAKADWDGERQSLEAEVSSVRSDLSVAVRLQTLRENDLEELQLRYSELLEKKENQDELLVKLDDRLSVASACLNELEFDNEGFDSDIAKRLLKSLTDGSAG